MLKPARTVLAVFSFAVFLINGTSSFAQEERCFLSASQTTIESGDIIFWKLETDGFGNEARAYWAGNYQGGQYIPEVISDYQGGNWEKPYFYGDAKPGKHTRLVEIKAKDGTLLCRTAPVEITVKEREKIKIGPIPLPIEKQKPKPAKVDPVFGAPIAQKCEASFSVSCNPTTLKTNWNLGEGEGCNIFIRSDTGDYSIGNKCSGSAQISEVGGQQIQEGGNYKLFVSNGKENDTCYNELKSQAKIYCSASQGGSQDQSKPAPEVKCSLTPSQQLIKTGGKINWGIRSTDYGTSAEWAGKDNGQDISPAPVEKYPPLPGQEWSVPYEYKEPSEYLRFARIKQKIGDKEETICTTDAVTVNITKTGELISAGGQTPKTITEVTINGQVLDIKNPGRIKIDFPKAFSRGDTQTVTIFVKYSDGTNLTKSFKFQSKPSGTLVSEEQSYSPGESCEAKNYHWLAAAKNKDGPAPLYCRDVEGHTEGSNWITQIQANEWCQGQRGIKALVGDGSGNAVTFYCNGQDWVDERTWLAFQQGTPQGPKTPEQQTERPAGGPTAPASVSAPPETSAAQLAKKNVFDLCDASIPCLPGVDNAAGGEKLYCRQIGGSTNNQYMYVTADYAKDQCSPTQTNRTALCGGQTYRCDGTTWREVQASGDQAQRSVRKVLLSFSGGGQVEVTSGQQIRIPLSGEARVTITIEYSDRTVTKTFLFRPPRGQEPPQPIQPESPPQAPNCPNSGDKICADSEGCTPDKSMKCGGYLGQYTNSQGTLGCSSQYYCWSSCRPAQAGECGRPAAAPQEPQLQPRSVYPATPQVQEPAPQPPAAQTCPGTCATSTGLTSSGKRCDPNSWLRDNHSCEADSVDFYCYASCP